MSRNRGGRPRRDSSPIDFAVEDDEPELTELVADHGIYFSADGRRRDEELHNVSHKKRRVKPSDLDDSFAEWIPVRDEDYDGGEATGAEIPATVTPDSVLGKRKTYASSVGLFIFIWGAICLFVLGQSHVGMEAVTRCISG
jgi:hypothetical protein